MATARIFAVRPMVAKLLMLLLFIGLAGNISVSSFAGDHSLLHNPWPDEVPLRQRCETFIQSLDSIRVAAEYPQAIRNLQSTDLQKQILGIRTLVASEEPEIIPWILPFLDSQRVELQAEAASAMSRLVSVSELKRRDRSIGDRVVLHPLAPKDVDLRPIGWVALRLIKMDPEGNFGSAAITIMGYLQLKDFAQGLREIASSSSPRAADAKFALSLLTNE